MNIKFIKNIAPLSDREINDTKDFELVLKRRNQHLSKIQTLNNFRFKTLISIIILTALGLAIYFADNLSIIEEDKQKNEFIAPVGQLPIDNDELVLLDDIAPVSEQTSKEGKHEVLSENPQRKEKFKDKKEAKNIASSIKETSSTVPNEKPNALIYAYEEAYPLVGMDSLYKYLDKSIRYPNDVSVSDSIQGTSLVHFTINQEGIATKTKVENSLGPAFDRECIRLINNMPRWQPAKVNGTPTDSKMSVPLKFNIDQ